MTRIRINDVEFDGAYINIHKPNGVIYDVDIRDSGLYRDVMGYDTFEAYCKERWDFSRRNAYYLIDAAEVIGNVKRASQTDNIPSSIRQTVPLARLEPDQQRTAWAKAVETAPEGYYENF